MSERLRAVVDRLELGPDDRVLEIGCGHGVAARRNARFVAAGRAEFLLAALEELELEDRRFDTIFAVRVGLLHRDPVRAHGLVARWLAPGGTLHAVFDAPPGGPRQTPRGP